MLSNQEERESELLLDGENVFISYSLEQGFAMITDRRLVIYKKLIEDMEDIDLVFLESIQEVSLKVRNKSETTMVIFTNNRSYDVVLNNTDESENFIRDLMDSAYNHK